MPGAAALQVQGSTAPQSAGESACMPRPARRSRAHRLEEGGKVGVAVVDHGLEPALGRHPHQRVGVDQVFKGPLGALLACGAEEAQPGSAGRQQGVRRFSKSLGGLAACLPDHSTQAKPNPREGQQHNGPARRGCSAPPVTVSPMAQM